VKIRILVASFFLSMSVLATAIVLAPSNAFASGCCGCGNCWMMYIYGSNYCYCGGGCPVCSTDEFDPSGRIIALNNGTLDSSFSASKSFDVAAIVLNQLSGGSRCFRQKIALNLLGQNRDALKFVPMSFDDKKVQDQALVL